MWPSEQVWGVVSLVLATVQYAPYFKGIYDGKVKPHVFTWFVWSLPCGITFLAQLVKGGGAGAWVTGLSGFLSLAVFGLCFSRGEKDITLLDKATFALAILAIVLWMVTHDPLQAVLWSTLAALLGWVPTVRKTMTKPYEESLSSYGISILKWLVALLALHERNLSTLMYPVASILATSAFSVFVVIRRARMKVAG